jgi:L,D-transpeptidase catalytic domain
MFRTWYVLLGMGMVVNLLFAPGLKAVEAGANRHLPAYSYRIPASAPMSQSAGSLENREDSMADIRTILPAQPPITAAPNRMESRLQPSGTPVPEEKASSDLEKSGDYLEIEVSHPNLTLDLYECSPDGQRKPLCQRKHVALGVRGEFPTPPGTYFVTHIYVDKPLWIPPKDRAWAAGESASDRVYGGTMAPLLKKRPLRHSGRAQSPFQEDLVSGPVELDDWGYRFHGTNALRSIGHYASHGCVRMLPKDAAEVAKLIIDHVGVVGEGESENGKFEILRAPVHLNIVK